MADHTNVVLEAARLCELALVQTSAFPGEPTHTKIISLAEQLIGLRQTERAEAYLLDGRCKTVGYSDTLWVPEANQLLLDL